MEARRYDELKLLLRAKRINNLKLQPEFTIQESFKTADGDTIQAIRYKADFMYERNGETVIEDVKTAGTKTAQYLLKRKLLAERGITITEVQA